MNDKQLLIDCKQVAEARIIQIDKELMEGLKAGTPVINNPLYFEKRSLLTKISGIKGMIESLKN